MGQDQCPVGAERSSRSAAPRQLDEYGQSVWIDVLLRLPGHHLRGDVQQLHRLGHAVLQHAVSEPVEQWEGGDGGGQFELHVLVDDGLDNVRGDDDNGGGDGH